MSNIREQVMEFHKVSGQVDPKIPTIPNDEKIRLRARLISEEFIEALESLFVNDILLTTIKNNLNELISTSKIDVDLVEFIDALGDLDYVIEGSRLAFGIIGEPIANEIQRSNMSKFPNGVVLRRADGKIIKPESWSPPDIKKELLKQGWNVK